MRRDAVQDGTRKDGVVSEMPRLVFTEDDMKRLQKRMEPLAIAAKAFVADAQKAAARVVADIERARRP